MRRTEIVEETNLPGKWFHQLEDGRIQCDLCPRSCRLREGQKGYCFVRERRGERIVLATWGRSSGFCIDPIEKKPLNHFYPGTPVLSFGTAGCNLGCKFCQNHEISAARQWDRLAQAASPSRIAAAAQEMAVQAVAFTYNDPVIYAEYAIDTARACRALGIHPIAVTAGYISPEARSDFFSVMDAANIDLKGFNEDFYWHLTGAHLTNILDNIAWVVNNTSTWVELTTLVIPGYNDDRAQLQAECELIARELGTEVPLHFTAFHPDHKMLETPPTPLQTLRTAREIALEAGLKHVYLGNVHDSQADTTYCAGCGKVLISRDWYQLREYYLVAGKCPDCGKELAGHFDSRPGTWGSRSCPVRL